MERLHTKSSSSFNYYQRMIIYNLIIKKYYKKNEFPASNYTIPPIANAPYVLTSTADSTVLTLSDFSLQKFSKFSV